MIGEIRDDLPRLKWFLWHGNVFRALQTVEGIIIDLETAQPGDEPSKLLTAASALTVVSGARVKLGYQRWKSSASWSLRTRARI